MTSQDTNKEQQEAGPELVRLFTPEEIHEMSMLHDRDCGIEFAFSSWSHGLTPVIRVKVDHCNCRRARYIAALALHSDTGGGV